MIYKEYKTNTYNIYTVKTNKFKTCHMEIVFRNNIKRNEITKRSLITELLVENSLEFNTRKKMITELENLYNSYFYGVTNRVGSTVLTSFCFDFINPKLVDEKIDSFIKFPIKSILYPNVTNNEFDVTTFLYVKERVKKDIESIVEDPKNYSIDKLLNVMCEDSASSININGYLSDLNDINNSNIFDYYKSMLMHDYVDIYIIGDIDMDNVVDIIKNNFKLNVFKNHNVSYEVVNKQVKKERIVYDSIDCSQENICIGLNIRDINRFEKNYVSNIYNMILGGGSLDTKLYEKLRNENSLCYNCVSLYQKFDGLFLLHTAINKENEKLAINLMKSALDDMKNGNVTLEEIENAKKAIITSLNMSFDNPGRIIDNYLFKNLFDLDDLDIRIKEYNKVSKSDIVNFAKKVSINTILCLKDDENGKD
mgnify:FL=1